MGTFLDSQILLLCKFTIVLNKNSGGGKEVEVGSSRDIGKGDEGFSSTVPKRLALEN